MIVSSDDDVPPTPEVEVNKGRRRRVKKLVSRQGVTRSHNYNFFDMKKPFKRHKTI